MHSQVKAVVIGLGAGLLPMFLNRCLPFVHTEVILRLNHLPEEKKIKSFDIIIGDITHLVQMR